MNFIVSSAKLSKHLQSISGVVGKTSHLPILESFLFELSPSRLIVSAANTESVLSTELEVRDYKTGSICIPAVMLMDMLKNLPDVPVLFKVDTATYAVSMIWPNGKSKTVGFDPEGFPKQDSIVDHHAIAMPGKILLSAIKQALFAAGNDDLRPIMMGMFVNMDQSGTTFVCTDGHRLVKYFRDDFISNEATSFVLHKKPLSVLKGILSTTDEVVIHRYKNQVVFHFGSYVFSTVLVAGAYPNYEAVIPQNNDNFIILNRQAFISSLKRVSIFGNSDTKEVKFSVSDEVVIQSENIELSRESTEHITCDHDGEDIVIGFNSKMMIEILNSMDAEEVLLRLSEPMRAIIIEPDTNTNTNKVLALLMPTRLNK